MNRINIFLSISVFISSLIAQAAIVGPSAVEVNYSYYAEFINEVTDPSIAAREHARHLFGIFHSPRLVSQFGLSPFKFGGIGAPRNDQEIKGQILEIIHPMQMRVGYTLKGKLILHKDVAAKLIAARKLTIPMPYQMNRIYNRNCTDSHYQSLGDYWYFYDQYRYGCEYISKPPYSKPVEITITPSETRDLPPRPRLDLVRGDNDNGDLFAISIIHGFANDSRKKGDEGRMNYQALHQFLKKEGFKSIKIDDEFENPLVRFEKDIKLVNGQNVHIQIDSLLVETSISSESKRFAKFLGKAVRQSDVIIYAGHSGLGGNLNIPWLEEKAGNFAFNRLKKQIFYFDSCASYSYYLPMFQAEKSLSKIDIVTNGLSSYFHTGPAVLAEFLKVLFDPNIVDMEWERILKRMEKPLNGGSFLVNVGSI